MKYLLQGTTAKAVAEYDETGMLSSLKVEGGDVNARRWLFQHIPVESEDIETFRHFFGNKVSVSEVPQDTSFNTFWEAYAYKVGKKEKVIQLWQALSEPDRLACLKAIPKYNRWLAQKANIEKLYPQTFLSQRRWENEFAG
jgi:hypothetical protein